MNLKKKNIQKTFGIRKQYKPSQLITTDNCIFRVVKNRSNFTDCYMCNLDLNEQKEWCKYCIDNLHCCYFKLIKKHKG